MDLLLQKGYILDHMKHSHLKFNTKYGAPARFSMKKITTFLNIGNNSMFIVLEGASSIIDLKYS
jgi:hypothetical protein